MGVTLLGVKPWEIKRDKDHFAVTIIDRITPQAKHNTQEPFPVLLFAHIWTSLRPFFAARWKRHFLAWREASINGRSWIVIKYQPILICIGLKWPYQMLLLDFTSLSSSSRSLLCHFCSSLTEHFDAATLEGLNAAIRGFGRCWEEQYLKWSSWNSTKEVSTFANGRHRKKCS